VASLVAAAPASAAVTMSLYNGSTAGLTDLIPGFNGTTDTTYAGVHLTSDNGLKPHGNGVVDLGVSLVDTTMGFGNLVIGLNANKASPVHVTGTAVTTEGASMAVDFSYDYDLFYSGAKTFVIKDSDGALFKSLDLQFSDDNSQIKDMYLGGIGKLPTTDTGAVPEPATWAMMIMGFGAVGGMMRVRRRKVRYAA